MSIPKKFYHADEEHPIALTVGELKKVLAELPDTLFIQQGFGEGAQVVVYNHGAPDEQVSFEEAE